MCILPSFACSVHSYGTILLWWWLLGICNFSGRSHVDMLFIHKEQQIGKKKKDRKKRLAQDVKHTCTIHAGPAHDIKDTDTKGQLSRSNSIATYRLRFKNKQTNKQKNKLEQNSTHTHTHTHTKKNLLCGLSNLLSPLIPTISAEGLVIVLPLGFSP